MMTKEYITKLKHNGNGDIANLVKTQRDAGSINYILENLGQLPSNFQSDFLYKLLDHPHAQVRLNAVKNIGKLKENSDVNALLELYN
ncbi:MAG TPA: HEAT repeat domain-containing protein, partial [Bacteroidales bacterium]|nr:HEAT repeat domain-containing protein [Bacteroidales bacterium]